MDSNFVDKFLEINIVAIFIAGLPEPKSLSLWNEFKGAMARKAAHSCSIAAALEVPPEIVSMEGEFDISRLIKGLWMEAAHREERSCPAGGEEVKGRPSEGI
jgi:hypothetical protein